MRVEKNNIDRKVFSLKDFRGVDYASSPLEVKPYRATDMANLLLRDGQLQKRYGFKQVCLVPEIVSSFDGEDGKKVKSVATPVKAYVHPNGMHVILQQTYLKEGFGGEEVGYVKFIVFKRDGEKLIQKSVTKDIYANVKIDENIGTSVNVGGDLYILCGNYCYFNKSLESVGVVSGEYYIPNTTFNIPIMSAYGDSKNPLDNKDAKADLGVKFPYQSNESINLLTNWISVGMVCKEDCWKVDGVDETIPPWFKLDGSVAYDDNTYTPKLYANGKVKGSFVRIVSSEAAELFKDKNVDIQGGSGIYYNEDAGVVIFYSPMSIFRSNVYNNLPLNSVMVIANEGKFNSMLKSIKSEDGTGYKKFTLEYVNDDLVEEQNDPGIIKRSTSASIFGIDGANDRIFVARKDSNIVYFSENDTSFKPNPMYFPVDNFLVCGTSDAPISGFLRATDGRLAILKDVTNTEDVAVYYTNGYYVEHADEEIGTTYQEARFTVQAGDIQRRGISARAVVNLDGDHIFASEEGVYGIQLSNNVASGERYARERSRTINPKITKLGLSNSKGIVYNDKYFLAVDNGEVYVADARYKFTLQGDQQNTYNYEWFRLTGLWVKEWFILDGKLFFIDKDGYICEFVEEFVDQYLVSTPGELYVKKESEKKEEESGAATVAEEPTKGEGEGEGEGEKEETPETPETPEKETTYKNGYVVVSEERVPLINASSYAVDYVKDGNGTLVKRVWELKLVEVLDENGKTVHAIVVPDDITVVDGQDLDLWFCVPISAYWQSAVMDLNQHMYLKNMWSLSMVASAKHGGKINLGYKTRMNAVSNIEVEGANNFNWGDDIDIFGGTQTSMITGESKSFGMYTFDVGGYVGINTYRRRIFERNFAHIQLLFTSETATDCAVAEMDIEYSISRKNIGVG